MQSLLRHHSPLAGSWYPAGTPALEALLRDKFQRSHERTGTFVRKGGIAFLVPHAGPAYSGTVAASAYRHVQETRANRVVVLGFSHFRPLVGIGIPFIREYITPLGSMVVDHEAAEMLARDTPFRLLEEHLLCDHSVEIQIPFLQKVLPGAAVLPLYVGQLSTNDRERAANHLRKIMDSGTVLVASSDLTHYGADFDYVPFPCDEHIAERLRTLDNDVLSAAGSLDADLFCRELSRTGATACGVGPISLLAEVLRGMAGEEIFQETLDYQTSGEITSDYTHSVSYGAAGFFPASRYAIKESAAAVLLENARQAIAEFCRTGASFTPMHSDDTAITQRAHAFVSLYSEGALRGCVGCFDEQGSLAEVVPAVAVAAAHQDPRFSPIRADEKVDIDIHILTPNKWISDGDQLLPGEHGGYLECGEHRGLLLPGVALAHGLDRGAFLEALAAKAGLPSTVYSRAEARLFRFREQVISDRAQRSAAAGTSGN